MAADTTTSIVSQSESSPSETHTSKVWVPTWAPVGVQVKAPPEVIGAPAGTVPEVPLASVKVSVSPASGSVAVAVKASSLSAVAVLSPTGSRLGGGVGRGHDHVDRLAVGELAVGDAHVEGVGSDLGGVGVQVKAPPAVIAAPAGTVPEVPLASEKVSVSPASGSVAVAVKASSLPAVAVLSPTGSSSGAEFGGVIVANAATSEADNALLYRRMSSIAPCSWRNTVPLRTDAQRQVVGRDRRRGRLRSHLGAVHVQPDRRAVGGGREVHPRGAVVRIGGRRVDPERGSARGRVEADEGEAGRRQRQLVAVRSPPWVAFLIRYWVAVFSGFTQVAIVIAPEMSREALSATVA